MTEYMDEAWKPRPPEPPPKDEPEEEEDYTFSANGSLYCAHWCSGLNDFEGMCNEMADQGYQLHSWHVEHVPDSEPGRKGADGFYSWEIYRAMFILVEER